MKLKIKNEKRATDALSLLDKKEYNHHKIEEGLVQLRIIFICFIILYGAFGYVDYLVLASI